MSKIIQNFKNISYGPAPEDSKDVMSWINSLNNPNHLFINGSWIKSKSSKKIQVINPATNKKLTSLSMANKADVNARNNTGETPLHIACNYELYDVAKLLITRGADVNAHDFVNEFTLFIYSSVRNRIAFIQLLLDKNDKDLKELQQILYACETSIEEQTTHINEIFRLLRIRKAENEVNSISLNKLKERLEQLDIYKNQIVN